MQNSVPQHLLRRQSKAGQIVNLGLEDILAIMRQQKLVTFELVPLTETGCSSFSLTILVCELGILFLAYLLVLSS